MTGPRAAGDGGTAFLEPVVSEGRRLDDAVRGPLEAALGAPFGDVVVHSGAQSSRLADGLDAAAFTVGRHVVLGPSGEDLRGVRGRMLLGHELAHVVQQRRSGGDADLGLRRGREGLPFTSGGAEAGAAGAGPAAAIGTSISVPGSAAVGIAREDKKDERSWRDILKEKVREKAKETLGTVEGVAIEAGQIVDTVVWAQSKATDLGDAAIEWGGKQVGASKESIAVAKTFNNSSFKAIREEAKKRGMVDPDTGAPIVSGKITELGDAAEKALDTHVFTGMKKEDSFFTTRELGQLEGAIGSQVALSFVGVEEVQLGLKAVSAVGVFKAILDAMEHNPKGFAHDRGFWTAVANAVLHVVGLKAASAGKKVVTLVVDVLSVTIASGNEIAQLSADYAKPAGEERDRALKRDFQALVKVVAGAVQQAISHHKSLKAAGAGAEPEPGTSPTRPAAKPGTTEEPAPTSGTPAAPDTDGAVAPPSPTAAPKPEAQAAAPGPEAQAAAPASSAPAATPATAAPATGPEPAAAAPQPKPAATPAAKPAAPAEPHPAAVPATDTAPASPAASSATTARAVDRLETTPAPGPRPEQPPPVAAGAVPGPGHADPVTRAPSASTRENEAVAIPAPSEAPSPTSAALSARPAAPTPAEGTPAAPKPATPGPSADGPTGAGTPAPQPEALAKPPTVSRARESADAGDRMANAAAEAKARADDRVTAARASLEKAKSDLAGLPPVTEPVPSAASKQKLPEAEKNRREAQRKVASAEKELGDAETAVEAADQKHQEAQQEAAARRKILDAAEKAAADRKAAAAARSEEDTEGKRTRETWEKEDRPDQAKAVGARKGENLHHAIELQVLDMPEFAGAFTPAELRDAANIRLIPREINAADQALLDTARRTPPSSWPPEVANAVTMAPAAGPNGGQQLPVLKDWGPAGRPAQMHQGGIRGMWDGEYAKIKAALAVEQAHGRCLPGTPEHRAFVRSRLESARDYIDWALSSSWGSAKAEAGLR